MTPKEKARELVNKICKETEVVFHASELVRSEWMKVCKSCARICVNEMLDRLIWHTGASDLGNTILVEDIKFWQSVLTEIDNL